MSHFTEQNGAWRKVMDWRAGDVTGVLPYSRIGLAPGNTIVNEATELLVVDAALVPRIPMACPTLTATLVHVMVDRAREFKMSDLKGEKMASLGKLAAGLAHELNNPASAATRSAQLLGPALTESEAASRALGAAHLSGAEIEALERARTFSTASATRVLTPLERADREEAIADWLGDHDVDDSFAASLTDTEVTTDALDALAGAMTGEKLGAALRWLAAGCMVRGLARDIERASSRVHELVRAIKGFTYMDQAAAPTEVDVRQGLTDTLSVMTSKAKSKSASLVIDAPDKLAPVRAFGGELNQVWMNLIDNALDAIADGGRVGVTARVEGAAVVVRVTDDGPGVPKEHQDRIFDPFFTTKPVGKGTGLGLDIVRRLVEQNNGQIDLDSQPGKTVFRVSLPLA
jgi:signal transduction histidine kinase